MQINTNTISTMTEANQYGEAIIFKNNRPKYKLIDLERTAEGQDRELTDDEKNRHRSPADFEGIQAGLYGACQIRPWWRFRRRLVI